MFSKIHIHKLDPSTESPPQPAVNSQARPRLGLRKCVDSHNHSQAVDVVFVHGLTGDRERTWTHQTNSCFWPEVLLPSDLPIARIFTYGYDADVTHFWSQASQSRIGNHAQTLLNAVAQVRERTETTERPLFFVAHSLGGLVVEDMLLSSKNSAEAHFRNVLESTAGIAFLGTPHCGSQLANWGKVGTSIANLLKRTNGEIVGVLQPESEVLARIQQEFHTMLRARNEAGKPKFQITCFYEDLDTTGIGPVVPKHSAILHAYTSIAMHGNHVDMTKFFDAEDPGYQAVSNELWRWVRDINQQLDTLRQPSPVSVSPVPSTEKDLRLLNSGRSDSGAANYYQGPMQNVGQVFQSSNIENVVFGPPRTHLSPE